MGTHRDAELALFRKAKKAGITKADAVDARVTTFRRQSKREGWLPSELAMSLVALREAADLAYGEDAPPPHSRKRGPKGAVVGRRSPKKKAPPPRETEGERASMTELVGDDYDLAGADNE